MNNIFLKRKNIIIFCAGTFLFLALYGGFNKVFLGVDGLSATSGGLNLVEGKCPSKVNSDSAGYTWAAPLFSHIGETTAKTWNRPFYDSKFFWNEGIKCIENDPWVVARSLRYVYYLFADNMMWPNGPGEREFNTETGYEQWYLWIIFPGMVVGMIYWWLLSFREDSPQLQEKRLVLLMILSVFLSAWFLKSELRYRVPFDVAIIPLAALGWKRIFND